MRSTRRAKIVATLGPASDGQDEIRALFDAGVDVFRLNFSHGAHADHEQVYRAIRRIEREVARPIGVIADLQGPKFRMGTFRGGGTWLQAGAGFVLDMSGEEGDGHRAGLPHPEIFEAASEGDRLLLDDGTIELVIRSKSDGVLGTDVVTGGRLSDRKGVSLPGVVLPVSPLTDKDRADLHFARELGCDWIALSFVQRVEDIRQARAAAGEGTHLLAKIEKPTALDRIGEIVEEADAVMVARGDLGVEMPPEVVPSAQKAIVRTARDAGKPVIVATQMLESMVRAPSPTRAEVSDVATAVYDGADAVMLSAETAVGAYPVESVSIMDRVITRVEADPQHRKIMGADQRLPLATPADAISAAAHQVANTVGAVVIVTYTTTGSTTLRAARARPAQPILCLTSNLETARRLSLLCGVHGVHTADVRNFAEMVRKAVATAAKEGLAGEGELVVITAGVPFGTPGATNILRIAKVEGA